MFWAGSKLSRLPFRVPDRLWQQYTSAGLFTRRTPTWSDWRIEVRQAGSQEWQALSITDVSPMPTSGYRQRMDRILGDTRNKKIAESMRKRLAVWITQRLKDRTGREIEGVRYVYRSWPASSPELSHPDGHWDSDLPLPETTYVSNLGEYSIVGGTAKRFLAKHSPGSLPPQPSAFRRNLPSAGSGQTQLDTPAGRSR